MHNIISQYPFLKEHFVEAVDGKLIELDKLPFLFNQNACLNKYGRELNRGEIGCTLSHRKCLSKLVNSEELYALVLEDDISISGDMSFIESQQVQRILTMNKPCVVLLSADYWHGSSITRVYDASGAYAYLINRKGAELRNN